MSDPLAQPLRLPCGATLGNRLCKAAMTEGLADRHLRATARHATLYRAWSEGGAGLLVTGNVMVDRQVLERPGNVAIDSRHAATVDAEARARLKAWSSAGTVGGNGLWMQISHAGRQSPRYATRQPVGPSAVQLELLGNYARPRALREDEILDLVQRFAAVAVIARETGFTGVQVHGAHGYLLSSFLSPVTNQRTDAWGGSLENRARFLIEAVRAVRKAVGHDFPVSVKLNSDDFRKGGFSHADCLGVVQLLNGEGIDYGLETGHLAAQVITSRGPSYDLSTIWPGLLRERYGEAFSIARRLAGLITVPGLLPTLGPVGMRSQVLMTFALRVMGNLVTPEDRDFTARLWRTAGRASVRLDDRPPFI